MIQRAVLLLSFIALALVSFGRSNADSSARPFPSPEEMLSVITKAAGVDNNFKLKKAKVLNLQVSGKNSIAYNPAYINWLNSITQDKWSVMTLLAHEVGHHEFKHTRQGKKQILEKELAADEFAGYILYKLGAQLEDAQKVMNYIASTSSSATHPGRRARLQAIKKGWLKAASECIGH